MPLSMRALVQKRKMSVSKNIFIYIIFNLRLRLFCLCRLALFLSRYILPTLPQASKRTRHKAQYCGLSSLKSKLYTPFLLSSLFLINLLVLSRMMPRQLVMVLSTQVHKNALKQREHVARYQSPNFPACTFLHPFTTNRLSY